MKDPVEVASQKSIPEVEYSPTVPPTVRPFQPTLVRLYGIEIKTIAAGRIGPAESGECYITVSVSFENKNYKMAAIYGYSYEGHCYSLPKPCFVVVDGGTEQPADGCGYGGALNLAQDQAGANVTIEYRMWTADKLDRTLAMSLEQGFVEDVILQQNVSGPKAPAAYGTRVTLAHRGGKLTD
jgi:hypothetical protein